MTIKSLRIFTSLLIFFTLKPLISLAHGGADPGGGTVEGVEFVATLKQAIYSVDINDLNKHTQKAPVTKKELFDLVDEMRVITVNVQPMVKVEGFSELQPSDAANYPEQKVIELWKSGWNAQKDPQVRRNFAMHELLSLKGLEATGKYSASSTTFPEFQYNEIEIKNIPEGTQIVFTRPIFFPAHEIRGTENIGLNDNDFIDRERENPIKGRIYYSTITPSKREQTFLPKACLLDVNSFEINNSRGDGWWDFPVVSMNPIDSQTSGCKLLKMYLQLRDPGAVYKTVVDGSGVHLRWYALNKLLEKGGIYLIPPPPEDF